MVWLICLLASSCQPAGVEDELGLPRLRGVPVGDAASRDEEPTTKTQHNNLYWEDWSMSRWRMAESLSALHTLSHSKPINPNCLSVPIMSIRKLFELLKAQCGSLSKELLNQVPRGFVQAGGGGVESDTVAYTLLLFDDILSKFLRMLPESWEQLEDHSDPRQILYLAAYNRPGLVNFYHALMYVCMYACMYTYMNRYIHNHTCKSECQACE